MSPRPPQMVALRALKRAWGDFVIDVPALAADAGEYLVILGPSGCGKSLLLGTVAGLYLPDSGSVHIDGRDVTSAPPEQRGVGLIFQRASLFPHLGVTGNIEFGLKLRGAPRARRRERVEQLAGTLGLQGLLDRAVTSLSGGEAQRVAIARALALEPSVLLLDEPLSLVDHNARLELQEELRRLHRRLGFTAIHVTHNREEARAMGQRCAVMLGGRIVQTGEMEEIFSRPHCAFVHRFLGLDVARPDPPPGCSELCLTGVGRCDRAPARARPEAAEASETTETTATDRLDEPAEHPEAKEHP